MTKRQRKIDLCLFLLKSVKTFEEFHGDRGMNLVRLIHPALSMDKYYKNTKEILDLYRKVVRS